MRWFRFPAWVLCFGFHVVGSCSFGCSRVETWDGCVTSPGKLSSAIVEFVAPLRLWHSLRPLRWLVPRWASSGPARVGGRSRENGKHSFDEFHSSRESREKSEGAPLARRFKQSVFWTSLKAAGPIRASVRGGAPPARLVFAKHFHVRTDNLFVPLLFKLLSCLHTYTITTFVILLIHTILQPFIKV